MRSKCGNVQKLDVDVSDRILESLSGQLIQIRQSRETWTIRGWGFRATREHVETSANVAEDSNDRG